jgi:hypothetical protein
MYFHLLEGPVQEVQFLKDIWTISAVGTLGGVAVSLGDTVRALSDAPVQVVGSWSIAEVIWVIHHITHLTLRDILQI